MDEQAVLSYLQSQQGAMVESLRALVEHESPSTEPVLLEALARYLGERFAALGAAVSLVPGNHLRVEVSGGVEEARPALLLCHFDTVWPAGTIKERPFRVEDNRALGPGIFDMKGGIVIAEFALRAVRALDLPLPRPVVILLNSDEEVGSTTSRPLIEEEARRAAYVLVLEPGLPPGGILKTARKGVGRFTVEVEGLAAHSGADPEKGSSAIHELAYQVLRLQELNDLERGTTVNVNLIEGGTRVNVIPPYARAEVDVRVVTPEEAVRIEGEIGRAVPTVPGAKVVVRGGFNRPPMVRGPATVGLLRRAQETGRRLGLELEEGMSGGGSDGNFTATMGVPTLDGLGAVGDGAHAEHEYVLVDSLPQRAALLVCLLRTL